MPPQYTTGDPELNRRAEALRQEYRQQPNGEDHNPPLEIIAFADITFDPANDNWLIENLLLPGEMSELFGPPNCGKTFLALHLALSIAQGGQCLGRKVTQGRAVYIAAEGGRRIDKRIVAWKLANNYPINAPLPFHLIRQPVDLCHNKTDTLRVIEAITGSSPDTPRFIVIETLNAVLCGGDENSSIDIGQFLANIRHLRLTYPDCHFMLVHHPARGQTHGRGHSSMPAALDTELSATRDENARITTIEMLQQREGEKSAPFAFRLKVIDLGTNNDGDVVTSCVVEEAEPPKPQDDKKTKGKKIPAGQILALRALDIALEKAGETVNLPNMPPNVRCVRETLWREYCKQGGLNSNAEENTVKWDRLFISLRTALVADNQIGWNKTGPWVWRR